jgi:hypothetical protein
MANILGFASDVWLGYLVIEEKKYRLKLIKIK